MFFRADFHPSFQLVCASELTSTRIPQHQQISTQGNAKNPRFQIMQPGIANAFLYFKFGSISSENPIFGEAEQPTQMSNIMFSDPRFQLVDHRASFYLRLV